MIGTLAEISLIFAIGNILTTLLLIPVLVSKQAYLPRFSSALIGTVLFTFGLADLDLSLWTAAVATFASVAVWAALFVWRGRPPIPVQSSSL